MITLSLLGEVDSGKTTFLKSLVGARVKEFGEITQEINFFSFDCSSKALLFFDLPGHEAFDSSKQEILKKTEYVIYFISLSSTKYSKILEELFFLEQNRLQFCIFFTKIDLFPIKEIQKKGEEWIKFFLKKGFFLELFLERTKQNKGTIPCFFFSNLLKKTKNLFFQFLERKSFETKKSSFLLTCTFENKKRKYLFFINKELSLIKEIESAGISSSEFLKDSKFVPCNSFEHTGIYRVVLDKKLLFEKEKRSKKKGFLIFTKSLFLLDSILFLQKKLSFTIWACVVGFEAELLKEYTLLYKTPVFYFQVKPEEKPVHQSIKANTFFELEKEFEKQLAVEKKKLIVPEILFKNKLCLFEVLKLFRTKSPLILGGKVLEGNMSLTKKWFYSPKEQFKIEELYSENREKASTIQEGLICTFSLDLKKKLEE